MKATKLTLSVVSVILLSFMGSAIVAAKPAEKKAKAQVKELPGLKIETTQPGKDKGKVAENGKVVVVHYTGWLQEKDKSKGRQFDSSRDSGREPFSFPLGAGMVIKGWDEGVAGMKVGEKRTLTISPEKGYGAAGAGAAIPPNATLLFDVELLDVK